MISYSRNYCHSVMDHMRWSASMTMVWSSYTRELSSSMWTSVDSHSLPFSSLLLTIGKWMPCIPHSTSWGVLCAILESYFSLISSTIRNTQKAWVNSESRMSQRWPSTSAMKSMEHAATDRDFIGSRRYGTMPALMSPIRMKGSTDPALLLQWRAHTLLLQLIHSPTRGSVMCSPHQLETKDTSKTWSMDYKQDPSGNWVMIHKLNPI